MALLLDADGRVLRANKAGREFFDIDPARLPASLVEVTLESSTLALMILSIWVVEAAAPTATDCAPAKPPPL